MSSDDRPPSGAQHEIRRGDQRAVVTEVGATLRQYVVGDRPVMQDFAATAMPDGGRGQVLAPWPNRVADGRYSWGGRDLQLPLTEVAKHNAIHGLVRWVGWRAADRSDTSLTMTTTVWPTPGYPFLLDLTVTYRLDDDGLTVVVAAANAGTDPAPYAVGQHPYLHVPGDRLDDLSLTLPARTRLLVDDRGNAAGREDVDGTPYDFRTARPIGDLVLDTAYTDLAADDDGWVRVRLDAADGSGTELRGDRATRWLQVFSGDTLPEGRRRTALAVEPMSGPPGAFVSGDDLVTLPPGGTHALTWGLRAW
jgi:galactose mutarotase-like enzyme